MTKRIVLAILWGFCAWMWTAIAHVFLGTPELSAIAGLAALLVAFILVAPRSAVRTKKQATSGTDIRHGFDTGQPNR